MKTIVRSIATVAIMVLSSNVQADTQGEIQHLLQYVENSGCEFERNGKVYDSKEARSHIERKYNYVRKYVGETEDFIKYAATESSMSGKKYQVICDGNRQTSAGWLKTELSRYRTENTAAAAIQ